MKLTFWGAAQNVTGSLHQLETGAEVTWIDCGMFQGRRQEAAERNSHLPDSLEHLRAILLTHAHIDHSGNLPFAVKSGFAGPIFATPASADLCDAMLRDTAHIQESDAAFIRKHGGIPVEPHYNLADVDATMRLFRRVPYHQTTSVSESIMCAPYDAGHMLGSSFLVVDAKEGGASKRIVFSGDVGRPGLPIVRDPEAPPQCDYLVVESTYGDRLHENTADLADELAETVNKGVARSGKIVVPAFAVGRVQQLVLLLHQLTDEKRIPSLPVFVDSPLALNVTLAFRNHPECFDEETRQFLQAGEDPFGFKRLTYVRDTEESKRLNHMEGSYIVISPSGMLEAGRVLHHLKNNIEDPRNTILITGFQAVNTLGRKLLDGAKQVKIFGELYDVRAEVQSLTALSGHADQHELLDWIEPAARSAKHVFLVHGEPASTNVLAAKIQERYNVPVSAPSPNDSFEL